MVGSAGVRDLKFFAPSDFKQQELDNLASGVSPKTDADVQFEDTSLAGKYGISTPEAQDGSQHAVTNGYCSFPTGVLLQMKSERCMLG